MIVIRFGRWNHAALRWFVYDRIYIVVNGTYGRLIWTPFCVKNRRWKDG